ncbi:hypothetical protein SAMN05216319_4083 [Duganella sp. CF402]|uniref:DUF5343 domain-containing protein n=1 Tax=unclassified Duganella TaxID=2636909 RepID=UPI0008B46201|nr:MULTISPECIES: DUF5343 domain-containing protein [unclassified Duganella]RZT04140.1 hypothetical protein EV582_5022 [Duganella sp. BK701]SEM46739.1 hypothetical protein SAMN05216319_4083 [Duganella sp. CF402]
MASKPEKTLTPPIISFSSFVNFLNQLREHSHVPTRIDKTLMPKASGSQTSGMLAALKYLALIDDAGKPYQQFHDLVMKDDAGRKEIFAAILKRSYDFLFSDLDFDLEKATSGEMTEKFRKLDITGSTITKTVAFFLAAAKEANIKVSTHIKPPTTPRQSVTKRNGRSKDKGDPPPPQDKIDGDEDSDTERFEIPIPGKSSVKVIVPADLDADDWAMLQSMITVYINRWKSFKS